MVVGRRRPVHDAYVAVSFDLRQLRQLMQCVVVGGGMDRGGDKRPRALADCGLDRRRIDPRVVDVDRPHGGVLGDMLLVGADRLGGARRPGARMRLDRARRRRCSQPVASRPIPTVRAASHRSRSGRRVGRAPVRRRARSSRGGHPRRAGPGCPTSAFLRGRPHRQRRAAVERERRDCHSCITQRDEFGQPTGGLLLKEADRVRPIGGGCPPGMRLGRHR